MAGLSPTQRTISYMTNKLNRKCAVVEKFNPHVGMHGIRQDLFGFIDIIAIDQTDGIIAVQSCGQSFSEHINKMMVDRREEMLNWLEHAEVELIAWRKVKNKLKAGGYGKGYRWLPRIADFWIGADGELCFEERSKDEVAI